MISDGLRDMSDHLRFLLDQGLSLPAALDRLRDATDHPIEAVSALRRVRGMTMESAVQALGARPVWRERVAKMQADIEAFFGEG